MRAFSRGRGADAILITAATRSSDPIQLAPSLARDRAVVVAVGMIGMDVPRNAYYEKELQVRLSRSYGPGRYDRTYEEDGVDYPIGYVRWTEQRNMEAFLDLVAAGQRAAIATGHASHADRRGRARLSDRHRRNRRAVPGHPARVPARRPPEAAPTTRIELACAAPRPSPADRSGWG